MKLQDSVIAPTDPTPLLGSPGDYGHLTTLPEPHRDPSDLARAKSAGRLAVVDVEIPPPLSGNAYSQASDDQLLTAAKSSDGRAFEELTRRHVRALRGRVYSIVRNREDTEDVVQESLLRAYRHLRDFRESCTFATWITQIAINTALMLLRARRVRPEVSLDQGGETDQTWSTWEVADPSPNTERAYAMQEALEIMSRAVKNLPSLYRNVLEQYHARETSIREAADKLGITVNAAKSRLFRARRALRSKLQGQRISVFEA